MIVGFGLDVVQVQRIERILHGPTAKRFLARVFSPRERAYCEAHRAARALHYAGRFAAKEAMVKALGAPAGITWQDMEIESGGPPRFKLQGRCAQAVAGLLVSHTLLSLSHDGGVAVAAVVLEG